MALQSDVTAPNAGDFVSTSAEVRSASETSANRTDISKNVEFSQKVVISAPNSETSPESMRDVPFAITEASAKKIGAMTSEEDYTLLIQQHQSLVRKRFESDLSSSEEYRLQLIRWQLDCIEKARDANELGPLEQLAKFQASMASKISKTVEELGSILTTEAEKHRYRKAG